MSPVTPCRITVNVIAEVVSAAITQPAYACGISPVNGQVQEEKSLHGQHVELRQRTKKKKKKRYGNLQTQKKHHSPFHHAGVEWHNQGNHHDSEGALRLRSPWQGTHPGEGHQWKDKGGGGETPTRSLQSEAPRTQVLIFIHLDSAGSWHGNHHYSSSTSHRQLGERRFLSSHSWSSSSSRFGRLLRLSCWPPARLSKTW